MSNGHVSICMPLYNAERYLDEAIGGVLAQTYEDFELTICDNCSTDRSLEIAEAYQRKDERVRVVCNSRNIGYAGNLHKVTSLARGDFMMVHCADDTAQPQALARLMALARLPDVDPARTILMSDAHVIDAEGRRVGVLVRSPDGYDNLQVPASRYVPTGRVDRFRGLDALRDVIPRIRTTGFLGAILYPRAIYQEIDGVYSGMTYSPDADYLYTLLSTDPEVLWLGEALFSWRLHDTNQMSRARADGVIKSALDAYMYTFKYDPAFLSRAGVRREDIVEKFVDEFCLRNALRELQSGSRLLAFRYLCFALATYPKVAVRNPKLYAGFVGCLSGPLGHRLAGEGHRRGWWRSEGWRALQRYAGRRSRT